MSIVLDTASLTRKEYSWRIEIFAEAGTDPHVVFHREIRSLDTQDRVVGVPDRGPPPVSRRLSQIAAQSFSTLSGAKSLTGAEIADLLTKAGDDLRQEDMAATASGGNAP